MQWAVRPTTLFDDNLISRARSIDVICSRVTFAELRETVALLKNNKQCGADGIPAEFWKTCCLPGSPSCDWILYLFEIIWSNKQVPDSWHLAKVSAIFKKGDQSQCSNFRPISLLSTGYKEWVTRSSTLRAKHLEETSVRSIDVLIS